MRPAVFLDRDGVINRTFVRDGVSHPPDNLDEFDFLPGVIDATQRLKHAGWPMVVVTNQPDVARGLQTREGIEVMHQHVRKHLGVLDILTCCHDTADDCPCRKPRPGMLLEAAQRLGIDLDRSIMVGDRWTDVVAGQAAGCSTVLIVTPHSGQERCLPDQRVSDLSEAVTWILGGMKKRTGLICAL